MTDSKQPELESLPAEEICRRCAAPLVPRFRGKALGGRIEAAATLKRAQRMFFAIWTLHVYGSDGWLELCRRLAHVVDHEHVWSSMKEAADYCELPALGRMVSEFESLRAEPVRNRSCIAELDTELQRLLPYALSRVADEIRRAPCEFMDGAG